MTVNRCPNCNRVTFRFFMAGDEIWHGSSDCRNDHIGEMWDIFGAKVEEPTLLCTCCGKIIKISQFQVKDE